MRAGVANDLPTSELMDAMLAVRAAFWKQYCKLHDLVVKFVARSVSIDVQGRISKAGDPEMRRALYEAASAMLTRFRGKDKLKTWGLMLAKRGCHRKATVAVAHKMAVVMHAIWSGSAAYIGDAAVRKADVAARAAVRTRKLLGAHA